MEITKQTAQRLYDESPGWFQEQLVEEFGKECFDKNTYESIKTFEDACARLQIIPGKLFHKLDTPDEIAYKKLKVISRAIHDGWLPDWKNTDQRKWFPWFSVLSSGFGFSGSFFSYVITAASVGSRLCFESEEKATYVGNQFLQLYEELLTIK
jgi:hypothetical protein